MVGKDETADAGFAQVQASGLKYGEIRSGLTRASNAVAFPKKWEALDLPMGAS
jgi:hypothetical protein